MLNENEGRKYVRKVRHIVTQLGEYLNHMNNNSFVLVCYSTAEF